ncbi:hypothetical protein D9601_08505 [Sphingomonas sp. MA1305]|uniref:hypothetical protein n=1 Tax=Sphingomonas sp. MA1305 TaxID=2479204 RepID=UPI0018DFEFB1|nr:hypothetical protein [Sphingomonas sp. MA1305]MBI0475390.1 hypothetical protein [Sphingomonas sp. MA1305]
MLNTRRELARNVGTELIALEELVDGALVGLAAVQSTAIAGRRAAKLPLHTGQEALEQLAGAMPALIAVRKAIHDAHLTFRAVQDDMRVGPISYGDYGDTPRETVPMGGAEAAPVLTLVDAAA